MTRPPVQAGQRRLATKVAGRPAGPQASGVSEDRQFPRFATDSQIVIRGTDGAEMGVGRTTNLSRGGLCAAIGAALDRGARVDASIALVFAGDNLSEPLTLPARVVWCTSLGDHHQVGLAFLPLAREQMKFLDMFIRFLTDGRADEGDEPPTAPGRKTFDRG
jgi:hypothetical protein